MIKFRNLFNLKYFTLIIIIQATIALLFVNTIGDEVEDYFTYTQLISKEPPMQLQMIYIMDEHSSIESKEQFNLIINELEDNGANIYYRIVYYNDTGEQVLLIDEALTTKQNHKSPEDICIELSLNYGELCSDFPIEVKNSEELKSIILDDFRGYYTVALSMGVLIEYYGDLNQLFTDILEKHDLSINFEVEKVNNVLLERINVSEYLIKLDRQNFISFGIIWLLSIILSTLLYLKSKQRNISILLLLGYSNFSILSTIIVMNLISLIIPYIILNLEGYYIISLYLIIDFIIIITSIVSMYLITLNSTKEKIKERI